jgi:hypothetical protein
VTQRTGPVGSPAKRREGMTPYRDTPTVAQRRRSREISWHRGLILRLRSDAAAIATGEAVNVRLGLRALPEPNTT